MRPCLFKTVVKRTSEKVKREKGIEKEARSRVTTDI
jgi:hypothetical protein